MNKIIMKMMGSCVTAGELTEKKKLVGLTFMEHFQLRLHTKMCDACEKYVVYSDMVDEAVAKHVEEANEMKLPESTKDGIKSKFN